MNPIYRYIRQGCSVIFLLLLAAGLSEARVIKWQDAPQDRQNLFLLGFGELTTHFLDISGGDEAVRAFEASNPTLKDGFSTNYRLSLFANGHAASNFLLNGAVVVDSRIGDEYRTIDPSEFRLKMSVRSTEPIWDGWRFTGNGRYDPSRQWELANLDTRLLTQPQEPARLELLMRLESDEHGLVEGGSIRPSFKNASFTLHRRSIFGVYADLHNERVGAEAVGGKLEGSSYREGTVAGIRADGTSGPYDLQNAPITRGSEEVKIEVRDRFDESTVLSSRPLIRDIDYTVDYLRGRVLLHQPVASETITSDPIYIVITYDYLREDNDEIFGGRVKVSPVDELSVSGSFLHRNIDNAGIAGGIAEPKNLLAADATLKLDDHTTGYVEVAGAENPNNNDNYSAMRVGAKSEVIDHLTLVADFQRIEDDFQSFTNSDLNPIKNQQRLKLGGDYRLTERQDLAASLASIRGLEANGEFNPYDGLRTEDIYSVGYRNRMADKFGFGVRLERRNIEDRQNNNHEDNYHNRAVVDLGGQFKDVSILGDLGYRADYELIMFRNRLNIGDNDANTNQLALTLTSAPSERTSIKVAQRLTVRKDRDLDIYDERQDATFATVKVRARDDLNTLTTYEYKRYTAPGGGLSLWQDDPMRTQWAGTFAVEYLPLNKVKALGKVGRHERRYWYTDSTTLYSDNFLMGQLTYFPTHHLSFNAESDLTTTSTHARVRTRDKEWNLGLGVNWNRDRFHEFTVGLIRRWQMQDYPPTGVATYEEVTSTSYIVLLSGATSLTKRVFARGSIKGILLNDPMNDEKTYATVEIGYDSYDWYRLSVGYERIASEADDFPDQEYTGQGLFIRFTGKM